MSQRLLIIGASVRPWIASARRAGFQVCAFDFFADWDAQFWCGQEIQNRNQNPGGTIEQIDQFEDVFESQQWQTCDAALICGGFENRGDLIRRVTNRMPVLGTGPDQLKEIARPVELFCRLQEGWVCRSGNLYGIAFEQRPRRLAAKISHLFQRTWSASD